tara:strand:- start:5981 stop:7531 length:1551 start_codon:yes stop_codon:yes gene_type:complete
MASTYDTNIGLEKPGTGEQDGTWGATLNTNFDLIGEATNGIGTVTQTASHETSGGTNTLPISDGASSTGRNKFIEIVDDGGSPPTAVTYLQLDPSDAEKVCHIRNSSAYGVYIFQGTYSISNDYLLAAGKDAILKFDGGGASATVTNVLADLDVAAITATTLTGTLATAAQTNVTSLGTLTALQVDNINVNGNTISSTAGTDLNITPLAGQQIVLDGTIVVDAGVVTGATSITSTTFVGALTGNASTATSATSATTATTATNATNIGVTDSGADTTCWVLLAGSQTGTQAAHTDGEITYNASSNTLSATTFSGALSGNATTATTAGTVTTAAQTNITSLGTLTNLQVDNVNINTNTINCTTGDLTITAAGGDISFGDERLATTGTLASGALTVTGAITATGDITAFFSDARLKENVWPIQGALSKLDAIEGVYYNANDIAKAYGFTDEGEMVGVIAQDVQTVMPHVVKPAPFDTDKDGNSISGENYVTVQYEKLVPLLIQAIKELKKEIDELKGVV